MRNSDVSTRRRFALMASLAAALAVAAGCGTYGDPCLRTTDCGSGFVCVEGKCQVDLGDDPSDAASTGDAVIATDGSTSSDGTALDVIRDASPDTSVPEGTVPPADSSGSDAPRDSAPDGDAPETTSFDVPRDNAVAETGSPLDATDARLSTDGSGGNGDAAGVDAALDADSGGVIDVTVDATDAAG